MRNRVAIAAVSVLTALALAACGAAPKNEGSNAKSEGGDKAGKQILACMISDSGGFDDKSFNESGMDGMKKAEKELGVKIKTYESTSNGDFQPNVDQAVSDKCDLVFGVGFLLNDAITKAAADHPDIKFALIDDVIKNKDLKNAKSLVFNTAEAGYLAGYVSAGMSKTGKVGTFLGMKLPTTAIFADGFADGIEKYNKDNGKNVQLLGWDKAKQNGQATGDFEDQTKGQQVTSALIQQGADIIMPVAGPVGKGALAGAKAKPGTMVVWVDSDGAVSNPDSASIILTSVMKEIGQAVFDTIKSEQEGKFTPEPYIGTLENKGVALAPFHDFDSKVPAELKDKVKELQDQIAKGDLKVESPNSPKK